MSPSGKPVDGHRLGLVLRGRLCYTRILYVRSALRDSRTDYTRCGGRHHRIMGSFAETRIGDRRPPPTQCNALATNRPIQLWNVRFSPPPARVLRASTSAALCAQAV